MSKKLHFYRIKFSYLVVLITFEEELHTVVPHLKALDCGKEPLQGKGLGNTFTCSKQLQKVSFYFIQTFMGFLLVSVNFEYTYKLIS